jgi:hypothetical protein
MLCGKCGADSGSGTFCKSCGAPQHPGADSATAIRAELGLVTAQNDSPPEKMASASLPVEPSDFAALPTGSAPAPETQDSAASLDAKDKLRPNTKAQGEAKLPDKAGDPCTVLLSLELGIVPSSTKWTLDSALEGAVAAIQTLCQRSFVQAVNCEDGLKASATLKARRIEESSPGRSHESSKMANRACALALNI